MEDKQRVRIKLLIDSFCEVEIERIEDENFFKNSKAIEIVKEKIIESFYTNEGENEKEEQFSIDLNVICPEKKNKDLLEVGFSPSRSSFNTEKLMNMIIKHEKSDSDPDIVEKLVKENEKLRKENMEFKELNKTLEKRIQMSDNEKDKTIYNLEVENREYKKVTKQMQESVQKMKVQTTILLSNVLSNKNQ